MQMDHTFIIYPYGPKKNYTLNANEYIGVKPKDLNKLKFSKWNLQHSKLVILQTVSFRNKKDFLAVDLILIIQEDV